VPAPDECIDELLKMLVHLPGSLCHLPEGTAFWHARPYFEDEPTFPLTGKALGSAPNEHAGANRMSPEGMSMFYGSDELETALEEVKCADHPRAAADQFRTARELRRNPVPQRRPAGGGTSYVLFFDNAQCDGPEDTSPDAAIPLPDSNH
jgi:hypothetical protein